MPFFALLKIFRSILRQHNFTKNCVSQCCSIFFFYIQTEYIALVQYGYLSLHISFKFLKFYVSLENIGTNHGFV